MKKTAILTTLSFISLAIIHVAHHFEWELFGWSRLTIAAPVIYAAYNFRRSKAIPAAAIIVLAQTPLAISKYAAQKPFCASEILIVGTITAVISVIMGRVFRKEKENSETIKQTYSLIGSIRKSIEEDSLLSRLEDIFAVKGKSVEATTYLIRDDGALVARANPGGEPFPPSHLYYDIAEKNEMVLIPKPSLDHRLKGVEHLKSLDSISQLAVFPIFYGGRARGLISVANHDTEKFDRENIAYFAAMKQAVESALDLGVKLRERINHEMRRHKMKTAFSSYLSQPVAEEILKSPGISLPGGEVRDVTVMFVEATSFRELTREITPEEALSRLNVFFSVALDTIFEYEGTVDKYIGESVMAFWGAPLPLIDKEERAVNCALTLLDRVRKLNSDWGAQGRQSFNISIGVNSGPVVAGNIGSVRRMEYTVIGDTVNVAARIKSLSSDKGFPVLVSDNTFEKTKTKFQFEEKLCVSVKGKTKELIVYKIKT
ncbi:MAG TPA: adenylate/guanylate cyclase domain-containing protein [bacterium]|nr:adenylate/guanylate cyclase domain-containing protein [bacterium]